MKLGKLFGRWRSSPFLNKDMPEISPEERRRIKMRYKDISKHVIWPNCRFPESPNKKPYAGPALPPLVENLTAEKAEIEDPRTPFPKPAINAVLRSDSEGSSEDEDVVQLTRL
ncbi:unnamed protein product, partial [Mesorhabditis spiculigera]